MASNLSKQTEEAYWLQSECCVGLCRTAQMYQRIVCWPRLIEDVMDGMMKTLLRSKQEGELSKWKNGCCEHQRSRFAQMLLCWHCLMLMPTELAELEPTLMAAGIPV